MLAGATPHPAAQLRAALALFAVHSSWFAVRSPDISEDERQRIALEVADELLDGIGSDGRPAPDRRRRRLTSAAAAGRGADRAGPPRAPVTSPSRAAGRSRAAA